MPVLNAAWLRDQAHHSEWAHAPSTLTGIGDPEGPIGGGRRGRGARVLRYRRLGDTRSGLGDTAHEGGSVVGVANGGESFGDECVIGGGRRGQCGKADTVGIAAPMREIDD